MLILKKIITVAVVAVLIVLVGVKIFNQPSKEKVLKGIERLMERDYGEEFIAYNLGTRSSRSQGEYYVAQVMPKRYEGTPKENDYYYHGEAYLSYNFLGFEKGYSDNYGEKLMKIEVEEYLLPKAQEIFGERILIDSDIKIEIQKYGDSWTTVMGGRFKRILEEIEGGNKKIRLSGKIFLDLFDRLETKKEMDKRKKDFYEFLTFLELKGLGKEYYVRIGFFDEVLIFDSFDKEVERIISVRGEVSKFFVDNLIKTSNEILKNEKNIRRIMMSINRGNSIKNSDWYLMSGSIYKKSGYSLEEKNIKADFFRKNIYNKFYIEEGGNYGFR